MVKHNLIFTDLKLFLYCVVTHRQQVLHADHKAGVSDEPVPQSQDVSDWLHQHTASEQHEVETGQQVSQTEDVDPRGAGDEEEAQHQPEKIVEHKHLYHVEVAPEDQTEGHFIAEKEQHDKDMLPEQLKMSHSLLYCGK